MMKTLEETLDNIEEVLEVADSIADGKVKVTEEGIKGYLSKGYLNFLWASISNEYLRTLELYKFAEQQGLKKAAETYKMRYFRLRGAIERLKPFVREERALETFVASVDVENEEGGEVYENQR